MPALRRYAVLVSLVTISTACGALQPSVFTPSSEAPTGTAGSVGTILFHSDPGGRDDFYRMHSDGTLLEQLTHGAETIAFPYPSPDGQRIAYVCCTGAPTAIWVIGADGSDPVQITEAPSGEPSWSPQGDEIAYVSYTDESIWVVGLDGSSPRRLIERGGGPVWSPAGDRIAYFSRRDFPGQDQRNEIYVANADGSEQRRLTDNAWEDITPDWSPDGRRLAWISSLDGPPHVFVMDADGNEPRQLTDGIAPDDAARWSPDGSRILFVSYLDGADPLMLGQGNAEIFTVADDGMPAVNLTNNPYWDGYPAWSPDGSQIAYSVNNGREFNLWVMNADGRDRRELAGANGVGTANDCCPAWQP